MTVTAPKCRLCGVPHWSNQPHQWAGQPAPAPRVSHPKPPPPASPIPCPDCAHKDRLIASLRAQLTATDTAPKQDRKAYMRDYMRDRRNKDKPV